ncbi:PLP-dependent cysteine synthase family protein [Synoicihabitans lomoniglobus]|uniref:PLP-dependent cysteine synthase family protein n=1 Tax=Synoicihabitans lomoniglobus TaxID=2909285 RepID=A0AAF0CHH5_9BACT|nr:PLP-dependent cysteine synthase family protein [Opitutaceae bacterium LMO-M01]WED64322.1 PLP-dependent cysteine synthase family protein [Opitutaceae bacterium LMO-M01]
MYFTSEFGPDASSSSSSAAILQAVGNTPLLKLTLDETGTTIYAKAEFLNPSGSIKDRLALSVARDLRRLNRLDNTTTIVEVSSGNTGIALAMLGAIHGCGVHILMSDTANPERQQLIRHYGARLTLFPANRGYLTGLELADDLAARDANVFLPRQFENPLNAHDHARHTGPEILRQIPGGRVDAFVSGYGTGGTLAGCGQALRAANAALLLVGMEPDGGPGIGGEMPCCELIEGIAGGFLPPLLQAAAIDSTVKVSADDAYAMTRRLAREFGLPVGPSSGANVCAALRIARQLGPDHQVATILCDRAERYFSTGLFAAKFS